jgi:hypothetical protein
VRLFNLDSLKCLLCFKHDSVVSPFQEQENSEWRNMNIDWTTCYVKY